ncbi:MAG: hypothetical protein B7X04_04275 [Parcubacteria group bacterium 21-54-25]|nr:MAG: hypothetical protein B7X04_04275 [Parcubacteria group bacterium 21-54-25]
MDPGDINIQSGIDFSDLIPAGETIQTIVSVVATPTTITVGTPVVSDAGARVGCTAQFTLGSGLLGTIYTLTAGVTDTSGETRYRSTSVAIQNL